MGWTKEKRKAYNKAYKEAHKEETKAYNKDYKEAHKEEQNAYNKTYFQTPKGKKSRSISGWKQLGAIGDLKKFYDERYLPATKCEVCEKVFKSTRDKCMDHCHDTGEIRWVLCNSCNVHDHWEKVLARKEEAII